MKQGKLEDMLRKVRALLATADHENTPPHEADTARRMAEALMFKYRLDEADMGQGQDGVSPQWETFTVCRVGSEYARHYRQMFSVACRHVEARAMFDTAYEESEQYYDEKYYVAHVVGYESDLRIISVLYTAMQLSFQRKVEPRFDPELTKQVNAYVMRNAGMEGRRIAEAIYGRDDKNLRPKVRNMYKKEALARGEDPTDLLGRGNNMKTYRESYAAGFLDEVWRRLSTMRAARGEHELGLVLVGRKEAIDESFYQKYPSARPSTAVAKPYEAPNANCPKCAKAKSGYCREHGWLKPRYSRSAGAFSASGYSKGQDAARTVDMGGGRKKLD